MRLAAVLPGDSARGNAGVRIRYDRLRPRLEALGHRLDFVTIDRFRDENTPLDADLYVFLKIYDARSLVLARRMRAEGRRVGIDLFDDYFSPSPDPRLVHLRRWFRDMRPALDLVLCGTPALAARLARLAPGVPCHLLADPAPALDSAALADRLPRNAARALAARRLDILWFGIGDNPLFDVGLGDLHAFADRLAEARRHGFAPRLRVLTNPRALDRAGLERIARLPVPALAEVWTPAREAELLSHSLLCFLPVGFQAFSVTKSLNRGMTALAQGAQILSAGYPLYDPLAPFVYDDIGRLVTDLRAGTLKLRPRTLDSLGALFARLGDPGAQAAALMDFLLSLPPPAAAPGTADGRLAVVHGVQSPDEVYRHVRRAGGLSLAMPQTRQRRGCDLAEAPAEDGQPVLTLSAEAVRHLRPGLKERAERAGKRAGAPVFRLRLAAGDLPGLPPPDPALSPSRDPSRDPSLAPLRILDLAGYRQGLARTRALADWLFGDPQILLSEQVSPYFAGFAAEQGL